MGEIEGTFKSNAAASTDVGFFGIFSGEKKDRVQLGGANDKTNRMAIACFSDNEIKGREGEGTKWVELSLAGSSPKKFEIKSIVARLGISKDKILDLYGKGTLEQEINAKAAAYQKDLKIVQDFRGIVNKFLNSSGSDRAVNSFKAACDKFDTSRIQNEDLRQLSAECIREFKSTFSRVDEDKSTSDPSKPPKEYNYKINIEKSLRRFDREAYGIDRNFSVKSAENNVIRTLWGDTNLVLSRAQPVGPETTGKLATRLEFVKVPSNRFSVLTTGKIYHKKPQATDDYVPYSKDGKTWVLLNIQSLASRLGIESTIIKESAHGNLELLIEERVNFFVTSYKTIISKFKRHSGFDESSFNVYYKSYMNQVAESHGLKKYILAIGNEIKIILDQSEDKLGALKKLEATFLGSSGNEVARKKLDIGQLKIDENNLSEFKEYGLFIKDDKLLIPLGGKDHKVDVEINGFVYRQKPESNEEYLPFEFKKGFWILLNVQSLKEDTDNIDGIRHVLNNPEELNDFINHSAKIIG